MEALPLLLAGLKQAGFEVVDVPTLLKRTNNPLLPAPAPK